MCGKNQLLIIADAIQHNTKNPFFNIALNIGEVFITVVKAAFSGNHGRKEHSHINPLGGSAGKHLPVQELSFLNDDLCFAATDDKGILQIFGNADILECRIERPYNSTKGVLYIPFKQCTFSGNSNHLNP
ncbi:MAG: hypothetical protein Q4C65_06725, partial [Eubacteriales bacterium]|nr:hypothetical protein [Eubacteriales bacterium]